MDDVPAGEFFILMPALLEIPTIKIMHLCIFFLFDRYVTLGIRFGSCFSNLSWLQASVIEKDCPRPWRLKNQCFFGKPLIEKKKEKRTIAD